MQSQTTHTQVVPMNGELLLGVEGVVFGLRFAAGKGLAGRCNIGN